jgi:hypothetical protein
MKIVMATVMATAMAACATTGSDEDQSTSSVEQDVATQTCTPIYAPPPKGGYLSCTVHAYNGSTYSVRASEADCSACGAVLNHELCVENNYPADLFYCNHTPIGGGGGGGTGGGGDPCSVLGPSCYQEASGRCNCAPPI